jgi:hypothetical protein
VISPSPGRYLPTGQYKHRINAHTDIHALSGIRTHDPASERAKTVHAVDCAAVIGRIANTCLIIVSSNCGRYSIVKYYRRGMVVFFFAFVLSCVGRGFSTGCSPVQGGLPAVCKIHNFGINSEQEQAKEPKIE